MGKRAMQEATFLILTALAGGVRHGYGIITDVDQISDGRVRLRAGTLYTALDRLRANKLIDVDREEIVDNRLRRLLPADVHRRGASRCRGGSPASERLRSDVAAGPGRSAAMTDGCDLERRCQRLPACYPAAFRREHEQEMLSVLVASAGEGQRRPRLAEVADLVRSAIVMRLRLTLRHSRAWEHTAAA